MTIEINKKTEVKNQAITFIEFSEMAESDMIGKKFDHCIFFGVRNGLPSAMGCHTTRGTGYIASLLVAALIEWHEEEKQVEDIEKIKTSLIQLVTLCDAAKTDIETKRKEDAEKLANLEKDMS